ncbi:MAG: diguanylate cyclase [Oligoflexia bacterium]|nr:diguanylate cyclase [Oligoflexia bacterium]
MENKIIYIIDDEETIQKLLSTRLNKLDYTTRSITDPRKLLEDTNALRDASVLLIDIKMPFIDGLSLLKKIQAMGYDQPAIFITGHGDKEAAIEAIRVGAYDFIEKPFDMDLIEQSVKRAMERNDLVRELRKINQSLEDKVRERTMQLKEANEQLERLSLTDPLTGLWNRRYLEETLKNEGERAERYKKPLSVIMIDADDFKHFNDTNGHITGDKLLKSFAEIFRNEIRTTDFAARYGGEEFLILLPETGIEGCMDLAERIRKKVHNINIGERNKQPLGIISISAGISSYPQIVSNPGDLVKDADKALYAAKNGGKNRLEFLRRD